jgi:hypothetical protein
MKLEKISLICAAALALGLASCSKNEPGTPTAEDANKAAVSAADAAAKTAESAKAEAEKVADATKAEAVKAAEAAQAAQAAEAQKQAEAAKAADAAQAADAAKAEAAKTAEAAKAEAAKAADTGMAQGLIDKAKSLVAEGKFSDASSVLQQLAGQTLSGEQTTLVNTLKEQIQKALAAKAAENAAGSVGNLLKK